MEDHAATSATSRRSRRTWLGYAIGGFGLSLTAQVNFVVALRARELGADFAMIGAIAGAGALAAALMSVTSGAVIDRLGPKRSFVLGAAVTAVVSVAFVLVTEPRWFLVLQPVHGVARNLGWIASQSYITSLASDAERARLTGRFSAVGNVGQMAGPLLVGSAAGIVGLRWALFVPAAYAAVFALAGTQLAETRRSDHHATRVRQGSGARSALSLLGARTMQVVLLLTFARLWTSHVFSVFFPVILVDGGVDPAITGTVMAVSGLTAALVAPTAGSWARATSPPLATLLGLACGAAGLFIAPHAVSIPWAYAVPVLVGIGSGLSLPLLLTIVATSVAPTRRGVALGLRGGVNQAAATAAPVVVGPLMTALGLTLGFTVGGVVAGTLLMVAGVLHTTTRGRELGAEPPT